jgi:hypothetical protein
MNFKAIVRVREMLLFNQVTLELLLQVTYQPAQI